MNDLYKYFNVKINIIFDNINNKSIFLENVLI